MFLTHIRSFPEIPPENGGGYRPDSFVHLMHTEVHMPGLDTTWQHTLVDAQVSPDGAHADLTLHSAPDTVVSLDRALRIVTWQPAAYVRAHDTDGTVIAETKLDAPLQPGQPVEVGGRAYRVAPAADHELWPHRHPDTGICRGSIDWQHVTLVPEPQAAHHPQAKDQAQ